MTTDTETAAPAAATDERVHALDHLRALAMLAGVVFHAALAYSPMLHGFWPTADRQHSPWVDALVWLPHLLRMPLFFVVAGFFTAWLIARRGLGGLMQQRARRILVPFLVAWPLLQWSMGALIEWAAGHVAQPSPFLRLVRDWLAMPDPPAPPLGTGHLWFLYYLLLFTLLTWIGRTLGFGRLVAGWMALGPRRLFLSFPLLLLPGFLGTLAPHPAPESVLPQFWAVALYGPFFALGLGLHGRLDWLAPLRAWVWPALIACVLLYALFLMRLGTDLRANPMATASWPLATLEALIAGWGTLACLVGGLRWFERARPWMTYLARSAYWVYLIHLPILFALQYALLDIALPWPWKFLIGLGATLLLCLGSYEALVRRTALRRWVG
jgi:glucan biosynthesis protein C